MNHLEELVSQWLDFRGYIVRCNVCIGLLRHGGHTGEIDVAAYHPVTKHCLHVECSGDADSWAYREKRFEQKFAKGRDFIKKEVFPWLDGVGDLKIEQWAIVWTAGADRTHVAGGKVVTMRNLYRNIARDIRKMREKGNRVIPEKYSLLRTIQQAMHHIGGLAQADTPGHEDVPLLRDAP